MKYVLGVIVALLLALVAVEFKLQNLAQHRAAPLPAMSLNILANSKTSARFVVPQDSVYDIALIIDRSPKNRVLECDFGLSQSRNCSNTHTIVDLDLTILENEKLLRHISVEGNNRTSWWGNTLGSNLIGFKGKKENKYEVVVQTRSSLEKFKELNPRIQVNLTAQQSKGAFAVASVFSIIALLLMVGIFVSLLVAAVLFIRKNRKSNLSVSPD